MILHNTVGESRFNSTTPKKRVVGSLKELLHSFYYTVLAIFYNNSMDFAPLPATNMADFAHNIFFMAHDPDLYSDIVSNITSLLPVAILSCLSTAD